MYKYKNNEDPNKDDDGYYVLIPRGGKYPWEK